MQIESRFDFIDGEPDLEQMEIWAEGFFQGLLKMMNGFYARADLQEVLASMQAAPFERLATQELDGESPEVIEMAVGFIKTIAQREIEYLQIYLEKGLDLPATNS